MSTPSTPTHRKTRADAERNRARVLKAARRLFHEHGDAVQMPEVARAAGVGVGTVYRHFPSRQALIAAVADQRFGEIAEYARTTCLHEPGRGLLLYLRHVGEVLAADQRLSAVIEATLGATAPQGEARAQLEEAVSSLIARDQAAGAIRADLTVGDVYMLVGGLSATIRVGSGDWRRFIELACDGLRSRGPR
ncbi:TetR family transcriptional regulator [Streptomyces albospinus]|uniref:TetR family transcriptional regulator n=1 Tax=Streptomyces albospinus TaxID=285515 RepID=A0ABQ2VSD2_9ACTN|nr:TetR/AcrR family transcriptional regulator [Streptomyces albospinus]GGV03391.1 TetR family transcriptional regulator [Streptomyces albospinus]